MVGNSSSLDEFIGQFSDPIQEYKFYDGTETIRYDVHNHIYYRVTPKGLERLEGASSVGHIIDKSEALVPWACKMMEQSIHRQTEPFRGFDFPRFTWGEFDEIIRRSKAAHKEKLEDAGKLGNIAHAWIEQYIKNCIRHETTLLTLPTDPKVLSCIQAALKWMQQHNVRWRYTERKIFSRKYKYAGTMDGLCLVDSCNDPDCCPDQFKDRLSVADWKTSNDLYIEYLLQTAGYKQAYEEETGEEVPDRWVIRLGKDDAKFEPWHLPEHTFKADLAAFLEALALRRSIDALEARTAAVKRGKTASRKAKRHADRQTAHQLACPASAKYKGVRAPTCKSGIGGGPCKACLEKRELHKEKTCKTKTIVV